MTPEEALLHIQRIVETRWWQRSDVWIGIAGLVFSFLAFIEAKQAKRAAKAAGKIVKMQTVVSELTEISTRLDRLDPDIDFTQARDFINEVSRRVRRLISPFVTDPDLSSSINLLRDTLREAVDALNNVIQEDNAPEAPRATYFGVQSPLLSVNGQIADLLGLLESKSAHIEERNRRKPWRRWNINRLLTAPQSEQDNRRE